MSMQLDSAGKDTNVIRSCTPGNITIGTQTYTSSLIVATSSLQTDWPPRNIISFDESHVGPILALDPELVLLGTGSRLVFPDASKLRAIIERGIGYEIMDTAAACRTYNVLAAEGRHVVAGLIIEK